MKILVATDGSEFSKAAIEKCCQIVAEPENTAIKIVSAYQVVVPFDIHAVSVEYSLEMERATQRQAEEFVAEAAAAIRECFPNSNIDITTQVLVGASDHVIIETAKEWNADLIVVGSHGRGFWGRVMVGSVSDSLVHHAPCSVLVVRKGERENK
ncbi:MAG: universal stress protein [Acidobacteriota bacterium]|nr:universal stress protein [Acidobacteriota bacterium]